MTGHGPLAGIRVLEFAGIGPGPYCTMLLSDMGADVVRIDRVGHEMMADPVTSRGRVSIALDLKDDAGRATAMAAIGQADVLIEGFRPGVMERLGLGPEPALAVNPGLIYGRMTGWGQDGPLAASVGHDINYIAITGALDEIGEPDRPPVPPLNLVGDFGGGSLFLAYGIALALFERTRSGKGQVIDAAIVDGTASLLAPLCGMRDLIGRGRGGNQLGGASPTYRTYRCSDGGYISIGAIEEHFWQALVAGLGMAPQEAVRTTVTAPALIKRLEAIFSTATRDEWCERLAHIDGCVAPVLSIEEAVDHPHIRARGTYQTVDGIIQPAPAPRLSRTPGMAGDPSPQVGEGGAERLKAWGVAI